jgi:hypothetical protein
MLLLQMSIGSTIVSLKAPSFTNGGSSYAAPIASGAREAFLFSASAASCSPVPIQTKDGLVNLCPVSLFG